MPQDNTLSTEVARISKQLSRIDNVYNRIMRAKHPKRRKSKDLRRCTCKGSFCGVCPDTPPCVIEGIERDCGEHVTDYGLQPACEYVKDPQCPCMITSTKERMAAYRDWLDNHPDMIISRKLANYKAHRSHNYKWCRDCGVLLGYDNKSGLCRSCGRKK